MTLHRIAPPPEPSLRACGDDPQWGRWIPAMWRALADWEGRHQWPSPPTQPSPDGDYPAAWWLPTVQLLRYSFGWNDPAAGLRWWYDAGRPTHDSRFALITEMLGDRVEELAGWYWLNSPDHTVDSTWIREVRQRGGPTSPCAEGGYDMLHLAGHGDTPSWEPGSDEDVSFVVDSSKHLAVLVVDEYAGWHRQLRAHGDALPDTGQAPIWKVEVICRPVGTLGTYRRSSVTSEWFAGHHRHHVVGHRSPS